MVPAPSDTRVEARPLRIWLLAAMVFVLPLHTVFVPLGIAWKPFLLLLIVLAGWDAVDGIRDGRWPWHPAASIAAAVFLVAMAVSWWGIPEVRSARLWLALGVGVLLMLVIERALRAEGADRVVMRTLVWSAAAMAVCAVVLSVVVIGTFGGGVADWIGDLPGIDRIAKAAYLEEGFVALTNWHQDPGYAAEWMNLWAALVVMAWSRGWGFSRWWVNAVVVGALGAGTLMTLSRTGWLGFLVALAAASGFLVLKDRAPWLPVARLVLTAVGVLLLLMASFWVVDRRDVGSDIDDSIVYRLVQGISLGAPEEGGVGVQDTRSVVWPRYVEAFTGHPMIGIGLGVGWATPGMQEPHNLGLELLGETGIIGLLGFLVLGATVLRDGRGTIGAVALTVVLASALTQTVLFEATLWFAAALYLGGAGGSADLSRDLTTETME
jgi:O-Antigen ligase